MVYDILDNMVYCALLLSDLSVPAYVMWGRFHSTAIREIVVTDGEHPEKISWRRLTGLPVCDEKATLGENYADIQEVLTKYLILNFVFSFIEV